MIEENIHFGKKYFGKKWSEVPISWLQYIANGDANTTPRYIDRAKAELDERGTKEIDLKVAWSAINAASLRILDHFANREDKKKGLYSWLKTMAKIAIDFGEAISDTDRCYKNIVFSFKFGELYPTLTSVMVLKENEKSQN